MRLPRAGDPAGFSDIQVPSEKCKCDLVEGAIFRPLTTSLKKLSETVDHLPGPWATELNAGVHGEASKEERDKRAHAAPGPWPMNTKGK